MADPEIYAIGRFDALMYSLFAIVVLSTVLRVLTRGCYLRAFGMDDVTSVAATITTAAFTAFSHFKNSQNNEFLQGVRDGMDVKSPEAINLMTESERMTVIKALLYTISLCLIKCTILIFYRRVVVLKSHRIMLYATIGTIVAFTIGYIVAKLLSKDPPIAVWHPHDPKYKDLKIVCSCAKLAVINSCFQAFFDIMILTIPIPIFKTLKLNRNLKIGIAIIYILGLFSFSTTLMRLAMTVRFIKMDDSMDRREAWMEFSIWEVVEISTALVCTNLPPMTTIIRRSFQRLRSAVGPWSSSLFPSSPSSSSSPPWGSDGPADEKKGDDNSSDASNSCPISKNVRIDVEQGYATDCGSGANKSCPINKNVRIDVERGIANEQGSERKDSGRSFDIGTNGKGTASSTVNVAPWQTYTSEAQPGVYMQRLY